MTWTLFPCPFGIWIHLSLHFDTYLWLLQIHYEIQSTCSHLHVFICLRITCHVASTLAAYYKFNYDIKFLTVLKLLISTWRLRGTLFYCVWLRYTADTAASSNLDLKEYIPNTVLQIKEFFIPGIWLDHLLSSQWHFLAPNHQVLSTFCNGKN